MKTHQGSIPNTFFSELLCRVIERAPLDPTLYPAQVDLARELIESIVRLQQRMMEEEDETKKIKRMINEARRLYTLVEREEISEQMIEMKKDNPKLDENTLAMYLKVTDISSGDLYPGDSDSDDEGDEASGKKEPLNVPEDASLEKILEAGIERAIDQGMSWHLQKMENENVNLTQLAGLDSREHLFPAMRIKNQAIFKLLIDAKLDLNQKIVDATKTTEVQVPLLHCALVYANENQVKALLEAKADPNACIESEDKEVPNLSPLMILGYDISRDDEYFGVRDWSALGETDIEFIPGSLKHSWQKKSPVFNYYSDCKLLAMTELPDPDLVEPASTILTSQGLFQFDDREKNYNCVLTTEALRSMSLWPLLQQAFLALKDSGESIKSILPFKDLESLNQAIFSKGGYSIHERLFFLRPEGKDDNVIIQDRERFIKTLKYLRENVKFVSDSSYFSMRKSDVYNLITANGGYGGRAKYAQALIDAGADVNAIDNKGKSALDYAVVSGQLDLVHLYLKEGAVLRANKPLLDLLSIADLKDPKVGLVLKLIGEKVREGLLHLIDTEQSQYENLLKRLESLEAKRIGEAKVQQPVRLNMEALRVDSLKQLAKIEEIKDEQLSGQIWVINAMRALGFYADEGGVCFGRSCSRRDDGLAGQSKAHQDNLKKIYSVINYLQEAVIQGEQLPLQETKERIGWLTLARHVEMDPAKQEKAMVILAKINTLFALTIDVVLIAKQKALIKMLKSLEAEQDAQIDDQIQALSAVLLDIGGVNLPYRRQEDLVENSIKYLENCSPAIKEKVQHIIKEAIKAIPAEHLEFFNQTKALFTRIDLYQNASLAHDVVMLIKDTMNSKPLEEDIKKAEFYAEFFPPGELPEYQSSSAALALVVRPILAEHGFCMAPMFVGGYKIEDLPSYLEKLRVSFKDYPHTVEIVLGCRGHSIYLGYDPMLNQFHLENSNSYLKHFNAGDKSVLADDIKMAFEYIPLSETYASNFDKSKPRPLVITTQACSVADNQKNAELFLNKVNQWRTSVYPISGLDPRTSHYYDYAAIAAVQLGDIQVLKDRLKHMNLSKDPSLINFAQQMLPYAVQSSQHEIIKLLLKRGADPDREYIEGARTYKSASAVATEIGNQFILSLFDAHKKGLVLPETERHKPMLPNFFQQGQAPKKEEETQLRLKR